MDYLRLFIDYGRSGSHPDQPSKDKNKNNFYYLALLRNKHLNSGWQIHGLWPNYANGDYPTFCRKVDFKMNVLTPIIQELQTFWPARGESDAAFFNHEYTKHGSCMFKNMTELEYFEKTLELYKYSLKNGLVCSQGNQCLIPFDIDFNPIKRKEDRNTKIWKLMEESARVSF